jgi:L-threonylcarbamoyladenylate synthase
MLAKNNEKNLFWDDTKSSKKLEKSLKNNQISIVETDTICGFLANITKESFEQLHSLKKDRQKNKPFLVLINSQKKLKNFININSLTPQLKKLIANCWPGPLTIIFEAKNDLDTFLKSQKNTIALRCPSHKDLQTILKEFDGLFSTSANKAGKPAPKDLVDVDKDILEQVTYLLHDQKKEPKSQKPSTIIDCSEKKVKIIRHGTYKIEQLEKYYGSKFEK